MTRHDHTPGVPDLSPTITDLVIHNGPNRAARRRRRLRSGRKVFVPKRWQKRVENTTYRRDL